MTEIMFILIQIKELKVRKKLYFIIGLLIFFASIITIGGKVQNSKSRLDKSYFTECFMEKAADIISDYKMRQELMLQFASQIKQNLSEGYWLYGRRNNIPFGVAPLEFYVDSLDDIKILVAISSAKSSIIVAETGEEMLLTHFYVNKYRVSNTNILDLDSNGETQWYSLGEARASLKEIEQSLEIELVYFGTLESYEWPKARKPEYEMKDLESLDVYQNFYLHMQKRAGFTFTGEHEVYLGLWNGRSDKIRMAWKWADRFGETRYSITALDMQGTRAGLIDEIDEEIFEKFKIISVRMF